MIQFNLLPDVKLRYIKAERQKKLVLTVSTIVTIASIAVLVFLLLTVNVVQRKSINDLDKDIDTIAAQLQSVEDLDKILTVQSQLNSLSTLHDEKVISSRLYDLITRVTPNDTNISSLTIDFSATTLEVSGQVATLALVNKFADSFKFAEYRTSEDAEPAAMFTNVVLTSFSRTAENADYTLTMSFDPVIFSGKEDPELLLRKLTTIRHDVQQPEPLFQAPVGEEAAMGVEGQ